MTREQQVAYWKHNLLYVVAVLAAWLAVSCGAAVLLADSLDAVRVGGFPLGFWFAEQGAIAAFVVLVAVYVKLMNALDHRHGVFEDD
jgi:putative solute:sodium symporter small subunit